MLFKRGWFVKVSAIVAMAVVSTMAADVAPMYFDGIATDQKTQQEYWDYLMQFKMFGAHGIEFGGGNVKVTDQVGWFGTSNGGFTLKNGNHVVGGPILIGGNITFTSGPGYESFTSGPTRATGSIIIDNNNLNGGSSSNSFLGYNCIGGSVSSAYQNSAENLYDFNSCPSTGADSVPQIRQDLTIPKLDKSTLTNRINPISLNNATGYIDVPDTSSSSKGTYDIILTRIDMVNVSALYIRMPKGGRNTRIFVEEGISVSAQSRILVQYADSTGAYTTVPNAEYAGNLLIYVENNIELDARTNDVPLQGTFISTKTITVKQQLTLAGQLLADSLYIDANFDGSGFHYVPFDAPKMPKTSSWGELYEGSEWVGKKQSLHVTLDKVPNTDVTFKYCFQFADDSLAEKGMGDGNTQATESDIVVSGVPLCRNGDYAVGRFNRGDPALASEISLEVYNDNIVENEELFQIVIDSLEGATFDDDSRHHVFDISILDDDRIPACKDTVITAVEDDTVSFAFIEDGVTHYLFPAYQNDGVIPLTVYYEVPIIDVPVQGLTIYGETVLADGVKYRPIPQYILMDTKYIAALNENNETNVTEEGAHYDSLTYAIELRKGVRSDPCKMYIDVTPVNDAPVLDSVVINVRENAPVDTVLWQLVATDVDSKVLTYSIDSGNVDGNFALTGTVFDSLTIAKGLNYEEKTQHVLKVIVSDGELTDTSYVIINVIDENEKPKFDENEYNFVVREHAPYDSIFGTIKASDVDAADKGKLKYTFVDTQDGSNSGTAITLFADEGNFAVKDSVALNYEVQDSYTLIAIVTDVDGLMDSATVKITVEDINEKPYFGTLETPVDADSVSISELAASGLELLTVTAGDPDTKSILDKAGYKELHYYIEDCEVSSCNLGSKVDIDTDVGKIFSIDENSGLITLADASTLNYETDSVYYMLVIVKDNITGVPSLSDSMVVMVKLIDINETPKFELPKYEYSLEENKTPDVKLGNVKAIDKDLNSVIKYSFDDGNQTDPTGSFTIDENTGLITAVVAFDYEADSLYEMTVKATDNGAEPLSATSKVVVKIIDVNETPSFDEPEYTFSIKEDAAAGTNLGTVSGTDPDKYNKNFNQLTYSWNDNTEAGADLFNMDPATGKITLAKEKVLNADVRDSTVFVLTARVADNGDPSLDSTVVVTINIINVNEAPSLRDTTITIPETTPKGNIVLQLEGYDPEGDKLTYTITAGNDANDFLLSGTGIGKLRVNHELDYETTPKYVFTVEVSDGELTATATVTVLIDDDNDSPIMEDIGTEVYEHNKAHTFIDKIIATDEDTDEANNKLTYSMAKDTSGLFTVYEDGSIYVEDENVLDYEKVNAYTIEVQVSDGEFTAVASVYIDVLDVNEKPILNDTTISVNEHKAAGSIASLNVFDYDKSEHHVFSLLGSSDEFTVLDNGTIVTKKELNYEEVQEYTIQVMVQDNGLPKVDGALNILYDTATVTIKVIDINEKPTVPDQEFTILETATAGDLVGKVSDADDKDILNSNFGTLKYYLADSVINATDEGASSLFKINVGTGRITVASGAEFDYETKAKVYNLKLIVQDQGNPKLSDTALVVINIEDVKEPPKFEKDDYEFVIDENSPANFLVGEVSASDFDENENLKYTIEESTGSFRIDYATGEIFVKSGAVLDYETKATYDAIVIVSDKDKLTDTAKVVIKLRDIDEMPVMEAQKFSFYENNDVDEKIGTVVSTDLDTAAAFVVHTYEAVSGDTALFTVDKNGNIYANYTMDYEEYAAKDQTTFVVNVKVIDSYDPTLYVVKPMTIELLNVNEQPYVTTEELSVPENSDVGYLVGMLEAEDPDGATTFSFELVSTSYEFKVETDGSVKVKHDVLDYETKSEYAINVKVSDAEGATSKIATVKIHVLDVNEAPVLNDTTFYIVENAKVDTIFAQLVGSDPDTKNPEFRKLTYELVSKRDTFDILSDGSTQQLVSLDYESVKEIVREARVCDGEFCDTATVTFIVENVVEKCNILITRVNNKDSSWNFPEVVYTNVAHNIVTWNQDGYILSMDTTMQEGANPITVTCKDVHKDLTDSDTVIINYSDATPVVTIDAEGAEVTADNIYTIVEDLEKGDTSIYVNKKSNDIVVTVVDPGTNTKDAFVIKVELDSVKVPAKTLDTLKTVAEDFGIKRLDDPESETTVYHTPVNGDQIEVSYTDVIVVNKKTIAVEVSYMTDEDGEPLKTAIVNSKGKVDSLEVMTVSYNTVIDGKTVTVSYVADAVTGTILNMTSDGTLTYADETKSNSANDAIGTYKVSYDYVSESGDTLEVCYMVDEDGDMVKSPEGDIGYTVTYNYVNKFGNSATKSVVIVLDQVLPKVEILSPAHGKAIQVVYSNYVEVEWTVNGELQDTLVTQGLDKGINAIVRFYRDKAGNEASDTVLVMMKAGKDIEISVEQPVTIVSRDKVEEYYDDNPPDEDETFAVSIKNPSTGEEVETLKGIKSKTEEGSGEDPYPNVEGSEHLGPTLSLDIKLPVIKTESVDNLATGTISGMATMDDLVTSEGMVALEGADAANSEKISVEEYVDEYCADEFKAAYRKTQDMSKMNLYDSKMDVKIWVYTTLGDFVNYYHFAQELNDPSYTNEAGSLQMFFEMKPDINGDVRTDKGRLIGTGSYVYKVETKLRSQLRCSLPPISGASNKKGNVIKTHEELLKTFGYKRPSEK